MKTYIPTVFIIFILGHLGASRLLSTPTKQYLEHTPRLTAQQFKRRHPDQRWITWGYPLFTFLWGLLGFMVLAIIVGILAFGTFSDYLSTEQFEIVFLSIMALYSIYMNAFFALGTSIFEMKYKVSGTGGSIKDYLGWPAYDKGASTGTRRVPFVYVAGEEVALAGRRRLQLSTSVLFAIGIILAGIMVLVKL